MKAAALIFLSLIIFSCNNGRKPSSTDSNESVTVGGTTYSSDPEVRDLQIKQKASEMVDSMMLNIQFDTANLNEAPVIVTNARLVRREYSNYKDVSLTFKNVSGKKIDAIRFKWYGVDAFGEPADVGNGLTEGIGGGFTDDPISPGRSRTSQWSVLSSRGKKIVKAWAYEVAFSDGSRWKAERN